MMIDLKELERKSLFKILEEQGHFNDPVEKRHKVQNFLLLLLLSLSMLGAIIMCLI